VAASLISVFFSLLFQSLFLALAPPINLPFAFRFLVFGHANLRCLASVKNAKNGKDKTEYNSQMQVLEDQNLTVNEKKHQRPPTAGHRPPQQT
jgi:hypothetical protein